MRKSLDGLTGVLREFSIANLNAQFLYAFSNKRRNRIKLLYFDRTGVYVVAKKLEQGTFSWPLAGKKDEQVLPLAPEALQLLLDGVDLNRKTINTWVHQIAKHLTPVAEAIGRELRSSDLLQMDETPMHYLIPGAGKAHKGYIWVMRDPQTGATYYQWQQGRSAQDLFQTLGYDDATHKIDFKGTIQCDGYTCYQTLMNTYEGIQLGACLAHIRRKFIDDESLRKIPWVSYLLRAIKALYRIERRLRNTSAPPRFMQTQKARIRQAHCRKTPPASDPRTTPAPPHQQLW